MAGPYYVEAVTFNGKVIPFFKEKGLTEIRADNLVHRLMRPDFVDRYGYETARKVPMNDPFEELNRLTQAEADRRLEETLQQAKDHVAAEPVFFDPSGKIDDVEMDRLKKKLNFFEDTSDYDKDPDRFLKYAKQYVVGAHAVETAETGEPELTVEELYIVWFSKTLQNWKVMISTSRPGDGLYFEVTHNGDKLETYVDTYKKTSNQVFSHHDF